MMTESRYIDPEDEAFNEIERRSIAKKEAVKAQLTPLACERCKQLEEQAYDLLGKLKVANLKWSVAHPWVGLTVQEIEAIGKPFEEKDGSIQAWGLFACAIEAKLKEKNT
jgi:hypothetical protein